MVMETPRGELPDLFFGSTGAPGVDWRKYPSKDDVDEGDKRASQGVIDILGLDPDEL